MSHRVSSLPFILSTFARRPWTLPLLLVIAIGSATFLHCAFEPSISEAHGIVQYRDGQKMNASDWLTGLAAATRDPQSIERTAKKIGLTGSARELTRSHRLQTVFAAPSDHGVAVRVRASTAEVANQWLPALVNDHCVAQTSAPGRDGAPFTVRMLGPARQISPPIQHIVAGALLLALLILILARTMVPLLLPHFTSCDQLESRFNVPCLGLLPRLTSRPAETADNPADAAAALEEFSCEGAFVPMAQNEELGRLIIVTGAARGVGKTFVAALLARACIKENLKTLLIDAGARADLHPLFGLRAGPGVGEYVAGAATIEMICRKPHSSTLQVITGGSDPSAKHGTRIARVLETVLPHVAAAFDRIIVDAGCIQDWPARLPNLEQCAVAFVVPSAGAFAPRTARMLRLVSRKNPRSCGCIINGLELSAPSLTVARGAGEHSGWPVPVVG
jgi:hypothetical protein